MKNLRIISENNEIEYYKQDKPITFLDNIETTNIKSLSNTRIFKSWSLKHPIFLMRLKFFFLEKLESSSGMMVQLVGDRNRP